MVKYACKVTSCVCLSPFFHSGARGYSKVYAEERLLPEPFMLFFAGSNPAVCNYSISPVDWKDCPTGRQKAIYMKPYARTALPPNLRYHSAKSGAPRHKALGNAIVTLSENGYRVILRSAKRFLSALCRRHSNFQPLFLHE